MRNTLATQKLDDASNDLIDLIVARLEGEPAEQAEKAIAAAAALAGAALLRGSGVNLAVLEPGQAVFVDSVNDQGIELLSYLATFGGKLGFNLSAAGGARLPAVSPETLLAEFDQPVTALYERLEIPPAVQAQVAGLAAVKLVRMAKDVLDAREASGLLVAMLVAASKTVPPVSV